MAYATMSAKRHCLLREGAFHTDFGVRLRPCLCTNVWGQPMRNRSRRMKDVRKTARRLKICNTALSTSVHEGIR